MSTLPEEFEPPPPQLLQSTSHTSRILCAAAITGMVLAGVLLITLMSHPANRDYIAYWATGKLLIHHSNPYAAADIFNLERAHGLTASAPLFTLNPPFALFLIVPLGLFPVRVGLFLWTLAAVLCVIATVRMLQVPSSARGFAYVFAPFVICLFSSQSSPFLLLGFALFLRLYATRPFWAGASLLLMVIKPHLFLIFWAVLLVDVIYRRRGRIFAGFTVALVTASAFPLFFDPRIWQHYLAFALEYRAIRQAFLPTLSMLFRALIDVHTFWLLFVPSAFAIVWGLWYYAHNRKVWAWTSHGMLLMLVTILASPYGYFTDEIVLLPAILFALALPQMRKYSAWFLLAINTIALYVVLALHPGLSSLAYLWLSTAWLPWFLYATWRSRDAKRPLPARSGTYTEALE